MVFTQRRYSLKITLWILSAAFVLLSGMELLHAFLIGGEQVYSIIVVLQILVFQSVCVMISDFRDMRALFTGLVASNYVLPGVMGSSYIYVLSGWGSLSIIFEILTNVALLWIVSYLLRPMYLDIQRADRGSWAEMCLMPSLFYVSARGLDLAVKNSGKPMKAMMTVLFFLLIMYVSYYLVFHMIGKLYREQQEVREKEILKAGIRALRHEMDGLNEAEQQIAVSVHDRRHRVRIMQEMMAEKNYDGMNDMLKQMQEGIEVQCPVSYTPNVPVNGVLVSYATEAEERGISFSAEIDLPEKLRINDWQFAVVIGNLLDHAIQQCDEIKGDTRRKIQVTSRQVKGQIQVEIRNTCLKTVVFDPETGLPVSRCGETRGAGISSVAYFAEKNQAVFQCGKDQGEFFSQIQI